MNRKRFLSWAAVSTQQQAEKISLSEQLRLNREHIERWNGILIEELIVPGQSRSIVLFEDAARKIRAYARLKELIDQRAFDVLIFYDRSRLGRIESLSIAVVALCQEAGIVCYETYDPPTTLDASYSLDRSLTGAIKSILAREEIEKFKRRTMTGRLQRAREGKRMTKVYFGYRLTYREDGSESVVIDEDQAEVVRYVMNRYLAGRGFRHIADELNAMGVPSIENGADGWPATSVRWMVRNAMKYAGYLEYAGIRAKSGWEPIISEEMAQMVLDEYRARLRSPRFVRSPRIFSSSLVCVTCGKFLSPHYYYQKQLYYLCPKRCLGSSVRERLVLSELRRAIEALQDEAVFADIANHLPDTSEALKAQLADLESQASGIATQRRKLTLAFTREAITLDEYESIMSDLAAQSEMLEQGIESIRQQLGEVDQEESRLDRVQAVRNHGLERLNDPDTRSLNAWIRQHFRITIKDNKVYQIEIL